MARVERPEGWVAPVTQFPGAFAPSADSNEVEPFETEIDTVEPESDDDQARRAENVSLHALTRRAMSVREMEKLLRTRDLDEQIVANEIIRLEGCGLLDDDALAADLAERLQTRKGLGVSGVKAELVKRLLKPSAIEAAVAELPGEQADLATAEARKRFDRLGSLDRDTAYRRLHSYLARRGFRGPEISAALRTVFDETPNNVTRVTFR
jgi:regulatory protein